MPPTDIDMMMLDWTASLQLPVHILLTKADKLRKAHMQANLREVQTMLAEHYPHASVSMFSSLKRQGLDEAFSKLDEWMAYERPVKVKKTKEEEIKKDAKVKRNPYKKPTRSQQ